MDSTIPQIQLRSVYFYRSFIYIKVKYIVLKSLVEKFQLIKLMLQISKHFMVRHFKVKLRYITIPKNCDFKIFLIQLLMKPAGDILPSKSEDEGSWLGFSTPSTSSS